MACLSPFAPHVAEEFWHALGNDTTVCDAAWPALNEEYLQEDAFPYAISFNGKSRFVLEFAADASREEILEQPAEDHRIGDVGYLARNPMVAAWLESGGSKMITSAQAMQAMQQGMLNKGLLDLEDKRGVNQAALQKMKIDAELNNPETQSKMYIDGVAAWRSKAYAKNTTPRLSRLPLTQTGRKERAGLSAGVRCGGSRSGCRRLRPGAQTRSNGRLPSAGGIRPTCRRRRRA